MAEDALVRQHMPLVGYLVNELLARLPAHISRDDLMSAGLAALAYAARGFDAERGVPFGRFASARIRGALIDELRSSDWASRSVRVRARRRDAAVDALTGLLGRMPTTAELAAHLGVAESELDAVEGDLQRAGVLSLHGFADATDVERMLPERAPAPEEMLLQRERIGYLLDAVAELPDRLRLVVVRYFLEELPMADIAAELGVSESRISQMRGEALDLLRDGLNAQLEPSMVSRAPRPGGCAARRREEYFAAVAAHSDYRSRIESGDVEKRRKRVLAVVA